MKLSLKIARILLKLIDGETLPASTAKHQLIENLISENIIFRKGKTRRTIQLLDELGLHYYLENQLQIINLDNYILALENKNSTRADFVKTTSNSKDSKEKTFKGFLVNCYQPIKAELNGREFHLNPLEGSFTFIYDYENFKIPKDITIIGVENASNFRHIKEQKYLFENINPLFISRYPQSQSKDFIKWMQIIPNNYLHFGDFDFAGIGIYLNEYKKYLDKRASFFIPENIVFLLRKYGNRKRFDVQKMNFNLDLIQESKIIALINLIQVEKKGLDQEYFIEDINQI